MARAMATVLTGDQLTVIVNVGDDELVYSLHVSADVDTVLYTLAGIQGPHGWGIDGDTFQVMDQLAALGIDTTFRLGDRDLANCLHRTARLADGESMSRITSDMARVLAVGPTVIPATDDALRTEVRTPDGWLAFQDYFVYRGHRDVVEELNFVGADTAMPAPGVLESIERCEIVVIAPSNPPLSVWPILAVKGVREALAEKQRVVAVSPLFNGKALKGPADRVLGSLGLGQGNAAVLAAYEGVITDLIVDESDEADSRSLPGDVAIHAADTMITDPAAGRRFAAWLMGVFG